MALRLALVSLAALAAGTAAHGQATSIVPDTAPGVSLGTTVANGGGPVTTIDGGTLAGTNLFHSFSTFNLGTGDIAQWVRSAGDEASITNVVNRVTGGTASSLFGTLDSTALPNADFYFVNPAGILFGTGAQVNVPASAHFSTASALRFANGDSLQIATPNGGTLSIAPPAAFGFVGGEGDIALQDIENLADSTFLPGGGQLTLSAANIVLDNAFIGSNALALTAVGNGAAGVPVDGSAPSAATGDISLSGSWLQTWPGGCYDACLGNSGTIALTGGNLWLDSSGVTAEFDSATATGVTSFIRLVAGDSLVLRDSVVLSDGYGAANAGAILIAAGGSVEIGGSMVSTYTDGDGDAGRIDILAPGIAIDNSTVDSDTYAGGDSGSVFVEGDTISLTNSAVSSDTASDGDAGMVSVSAMDSLEMIGSFISSSTYAEGQGGDVAIAADSIVLAGLSRISSESLGDGDGGDIAIEAGTVLINESYISSSAGVSDVPDTIGNAGSVSIYADELTLDAGAIASSAYADGDAGSIEVGLTGDLSVFAGSINSSASGWGDAGSVTIVADQAIVSFGAISSDAAAGSGGEVGVAIAGLLELDGASISTNSGSGFDVADEAGDAGSIYVSAGELAMRNAASVTSRAFAQGNGGSVIIAVRNDATMDGSATVAADSHGLGDAGAIDFTVGGTLSMANAFISSNTYGEGDGGGLWVEAGDAQLDASSIASDAYGDGDSGITFASVSGSLLLTGGSYISADSLGAGSSGGTVVYAGDAELDGSYISSDAYGSGDAGLVVVQVAGSLAMANGSYISSDTLESGSGGAVEVKAAGARLSSDSFISSDAYGDGDGGFVDVEIAGDLSLDSGARISTNVQGDGLGGAVFVSAVGIDMAGASAISSKTFAGSSGDAGDVVIEASRVSIRGASSVSSDAAGSGSGGFVDIAAAELSLTQASRITTSSVNENPAGVISLETATLTMVGEGTEVSSTNSNPVAGTDNEAGAILIKTGNATIADGAKVSSNSATGIAGYIDFEMTPESILILSGRDLPGTIETSSGPGSGGFISIASPLAIISNGGSILALGESGGANVQIDTPYFITSSDRLNRVEVDGELAFSNSIYDVSAGTVDTDLSMLDASGVLRGQCSAVRSNGGASVLNIRPAGPFGTSGWSDVLPRRGGTGASGGCP